MSTARRVDMAERTAGVDADAGLFHAEEHGDERQVHGLVDVMERVTVWVGPELRVGVAAVASLSAICVAKTSARRTMAAAASGRRLGSSGLALVGWCSSARLVERAAMSGSVCEACVGLTR